VTERHAPVSRRQFLSSVAVYGEAVLLTACFAKSASMPPTTDAATLTSRPSAPTGTASPGRQALGLSSTGRDGFIQVPPGYRADRPAPLLVLLHGAGQSSTLWSNSSLLTLVDNPGLIVVAPDSRGATWDLTLGAYGPDVKFIDGALALAFGRCNVDPARVFLGGFSDGASYALSLGASNGDLFSALMAFSPGFFSPSMRRGTPRIFVSHGTSDPILPIDQTSRLIVPELRRDGYAVEFREFAGGHTVPADIAAAAIAWLVPSAG
jgi:phospholipase/carboxylesterase